jgi:hypothetical protein
LIHSNANQAHFFSSKHIMIVQKLPKQYRSINNNEPKGTRSIKARQVAFPEDIVRKRRTKISFPILIAKRIRMPEDAARSGCPR